MRNVVLATIAVGLALYSSYEPTSAIGAAAKAAQSGKPNVYVSVVNIRAGKADVNIHNTSGRRLDSAFLRCTFRDASGSRIDVAPVMAYDIEANDTARETAAIPGRAMADTVNCRVVSAR